LKFPNIDGIFKSPLEREDSIPPPGTIVQPSDRLTLHKPTARDSGRSHLGLAITRPLGVVAANGHANMAICPDKVVRRVECNPA
jgi:hypothetical protein